MLLWDPAALQCCMSFGWEGVGVECDERVFGFDGFEGVVEGEEAGEVFCICYEGRPDCGVLVVYDAIVNIFFYLFSSL